jgi:hypothetical protein
VAMREVTDSFLLTIAQVSATLIGLFRVGVFFHVGTGLRRRDRQARDAFEAYLRASARIVLLLFGLPLGLSLALIALEPRWARVLFAFAIGSAMPRPPHAQIAMPGVRREL